MPERRAYDEDDWVGTPPEGRYTRDRARPEFWRDKWPIAPTAVAIVVLVVVAALLALLA